MNYRGLPSLTTKNHPFGWFLDYIHLDESCTLQTKLIESHSCLRSYLSITFISGVGNAIFDLEFLYCLFSQRSEIISFITWRTSPFSCNLSLRIFVKRVLKTTTAVVAGVTPDNGVIVGAGTVAGTAPPVAETSTIFARVAGPTLPTCDMPYFA